jgi:HD-like signal output (HDOD) protein/DNA-binding CsgD family transcriptional regulator
MPTEALTTPPAHSANGLPERFSSAFAQIACFPALSGVRATALSAGGRDGSEADLIDATESDVGLTIAVLRRANDRSAGTRAAVGSIPLAVEAIGISNVVELARDVPVFDLLSPPGSDAHRFERFRTHGLAVQGIADRIVRMTDGVDRDELAVVSLLHDLGRLAVARIWPARVTGQAADSHVPEERSAKEQARTGLDPATIGGAIARRWNFPERIAEAMQGHHTATAAGLAAHVRLADMLAHHASEDAIDATELRSAADACGLGSADLYTLLSEPAGNRSHDRPRPCPLSRRERGVLRLVSEGKGNIEIADELHLSSSTVRSHLYNVNGKLGVHDRAQAVLCATRHSWV